jgi:hypothetical protein
MSSKDTELVEKFVASFAKLAHLEADEILDPVAWRLADGEANEFGQKAWKPVRQETIATHLGLLYAVLPARFPPLSESLVLQYRWADVDLQLFTLFANPPAQDLKPLSSRISADKYLWSHL